MSRGDEQLTMSRRAESTCVRVVVAGDIDSCSAPALQRELDDAATQFPGRRIEADLDAVTFFSCAGLTVLIVMKQLLRDRFAVTAAGPVVRRVLEVCEVHKLLARH